MVSIPEEYVKDLKKILEWCLEAFVPDITFDHYVECLLEHFYERNLIEGKVQVGENELYYVNECISSATNYAKECGVEKDLIWEIYDWVVAEREKRKI